MIFYFSATGNSKWVAETIANFTHDNIVNIVDAMKTECSYTLHSGEKIGFVFPVHGWRVPSIVSDFVSKIRINNYHSSTYTYSIITCGDNIGEATSLFQKILSSKQIQLNAAFSIVMPESYIGLPFMYLDTHSKAKQKHSTALTELQKYAEIICDNRGGEHLHKGSFPKLYSNLFGGFFVGHLVKDKYFHVNRNKCISCGKCAAICPVDDISLDSEKHPVWENNGKCLTCYSCLHHCPSNAITWGWFGKNKGQYTYENEFGKQ